MPARRRQMPRKERPVRLICHLRLTKDEIEQLEANAAADLRSVASYVAQIILADLKRKPGKRKPTKAKPGDNRIAYDVGPMLLIPEREAVRKRAADERRSLGSYVTRLALEQIR